MLFEKVLLHRSDVALVAVDGNDALQLFNLKDNFKA